MPIRKKTIANPSTDLPVESAVVKEASISGTSAPFFTKVVEKRKSIELHMQEILDQIVRQASIIDETDKRAKEAQKEIDLKRARDQQEKDFARELEEKKLKASLEDELRVLRSECEQECSVKRDKLIKEEEEIKAQKDDYSKMKKQVESFPKELEQTVQQAERKVRESLTQDFEVQKKLFLIESQNTIKLLEQELTALRSQLSDKETLIASLTSERNSAISKIQELATEAMKRSQPVIREVQTYAEKE